MQRERDAFPVPSISRPRLICLDWSARSEDRVEWVQVENSSEKSKSRPRNSEEEDERRKIKRKKMSSDQNKTLGRVSQERADDETASTNLPHANWRLTVLLANNRQATDDLILDDG
jgi:hypothetical protein